MALQAALGQTKGQLPSFKFLMETNEQITEDLRDRIQTSSDREHACERQLQAFDESGDLLKEPRFGAVFAKFKHDYPEAVMPVKLPDLSANYVPRRNGGRSTYSVEITMKEKNCQPLTVFNLESNWPNEIYAAVCAHDNAETFYVIHCEWQQCKFGPERE
ncbi:MAG TPA: hypothetical protein VFM46_19965 [Pseudomonadales bacterium]|nr:hypothetical protein [Pseudomonadales bacterium]